MGHRDLPNGNAGGQSGPPCLQLETPVIPVPLCSDPGLPGIALT